MARDLKDICNEIDSAWWYLISEGYNEESIIPILGMAVDIKKRELELERIEKQNDQTSN